MVITGMIMDYTSYEWGYNNSRCVCYAQLRPVADAHAAAHRKNAAVHACATPRSRTSRNDHLLGDHLYIGTAIPSGSDLMTNITIQNHHRNSGIAHQRW